MSLPLFTEAGDLPSGIYRATWSEVLAHFGAGSPRRRIMVLRLERIYRLAQATSHLAWMCSC